MDSDLVCCCRPAWRGCGRHIAGPLWCDRLATSNQVGGIDEFLNDAHDFDSLLFDALKTVDESSFNEKRQEIQGIYSQLQRAGTLVAIAGPKGVDGELASIMKSAGAVVRDMQVSDILISITREWKKDK